MRCVRGDNRMGFRYRVSARRMRMRVVLVESPNLGDDFFPMLRRIARRYRGWGLDADDLVGEAALRIARELKRFDPLLSPWRTWVIRNARWGMLDALKKARGRSRDKKRPIVNLVDPVRIPDRTANDDPEGGAIVADFLARLDPRARRILEGLMAGESAAAIGRKLGLSESRISQLRARIRRDA